MKWKMVVLAVFVAVGGGAAVVFHLCFSPGAPEERPAPVLLPGASREELLEQLPKAIARLVPLHRKLGPPEPGDWLAVHKEAGQTFEQYVRGNPVLPDDTRRVVCFLPVGDFSPQQQRIIELAAQYVSLHFNLEVRVLEGLPLSEVPEEARRRHPSHGMQQLLSTWFLDELLPSKLPPDAAALIALTPIDLWAGEGWSFVYGQASLQKRVGVWSMYREGDPEASEPDFKACLLRTIKTSTHELGHMFSIQHCTAYECNMCGSENAAEADRRPLALCPECTAKVSWAMAVDPAARLAGLADFCRQHGLADEADFFRRQIDALQSE
jgi:archaemetzincin